MANPLLINVSELLRQPGRDKDLMVCVPVEHFVFDDQRLTAAEIPINLHLESVNGGIAVSGTAEAKWAGECRRCLSSVEGTAVATIEEFYQQDLTDPDAYPIVGDQLDLTPMVRELVLLELPLSPLCKGDCLGLCPSCGADLSKARCACKNEIADHRWDALSVLRAKLD